MSIIKLTGARCVSRGLRSILGATAIFAATVSSASAQTFNHTVSHVGDALRNVLDLRPNDTTNWRIGLGPAINPEFEGGKVYQVEPAPVISLRYRDVLKVDNNNVDFTAFDQVFDFGSGTGPARFEAGPVVSLDFGRHESDARALRGLGNVGIAVEVGAFIGFTIGAADMDIRMTQDVADGHKGATLEISSSWLLYRDDRFTLAPHLSATWATARYMKSFFGINTTQAAASGLPAFRAGSSFKDAAISMLGSYDFSRHWSLIATIAYKRLLGDAADSPLVRLRGSADQWSGSTFVVYSF